MHDVLAQTAAEFSLGTAAPPAVWLQTGWTTMNSLVFAPTSYARIFPPPEREGSGSQWTWTSEADTARARILDGASVGSGHDNNTLLVLARVRSPEGPCVSQKKC